jgi:hypothetical protein
MSALLVLAVLCILFILGFISCAIAACIVEQDRQQSPLLKCRQDDETLVNLTKNPITPLLIPQTKIVFLAAARNAMVGLPFFLSNLTRIKKLYPNTRLVVIENDSTDGTREYLESHFSSVLETEIIIPNFQLEKGSPTSGRGFSRVNRMCQLRNQLLTYVTDKDDFVVCIDPDWNICIEALKFRAAITHLEKNKDKVAGCFPLFMHHEPKFPFIDLYFDTYAFKSKEFKNPGENMQEKFKLVMKKWPKDTEIEVDSAFGTFGIYHRTDIKNIKYFPMVESDLGTTNKEQMYSKTRCEHIAFNQDVCQSTGKKLHLLTWFKIVL